VPTVEMGDFTIETVPRRFKEIGDPSEGIDDVRYSLEPLLELIEKQAKEGLGEAPLPPHFPKEEGEPSRVQPSRARRPANTEMPPAMRTEYRRPKH
jgi:bifunctional non-homologous end joining protein LigD